MIPLPVYLLGRLSLLRLFPLVFFDLRFRVILCFRAERCSSSYIMQRRIKERLVQGLHVRVYASVRSPVRVARNLYLSVVRVGLSNV